MKQTFKEVVGTSFHSSVVYASVDQLTQVLGEPVYDENTGDDKINFEWEMELDSGDVFTVYDWKEFRMLSKSEPIEWHIGGFNQKVTDQAANEINQAILTSKQNNPAELANEMVGDGQDPNKFFVTVSPRVLVEGDFYDFKSELLDGYTKEDIETLMFDTFEAANEYYESIDLDIYQGIGTVIIEDRKTGVIKQKELSKVVQVNYSLNEYDDSKTFGYAK